MKKIFLLLVLCAVALTSCNNNVETIPPSGDNGQTNQPSGDNNPNDPDDGGSTEEVTIIKGEDSFELEVEESKEISLGSYFKYNGTKYAYLVETEGKDVVETEILNSTLTVHAVHNGTEVVTVTLNDKKVEITFTVTGELLMPEFDDVDVEYDVAVNESMTVTLAPTVANGHESFSYSLKTPTDGISIDGDSLTVSITNNCEKTVVVVCTYVNDLSVEFNLNIKVSNSKNVVNGTFDNGLEGWTLSGEIGGVTENSVFWNQEFPMNNVGKYFDGHAGVESNKGTLTSSLFELGGNGYITFMLGGAANPECFVKVVDKDGNILAIYRNTEFRDLTQEHNALPVEQQRELIGTEINVCNLVKYKADLSEHIGKEIQIVIVDNAENNFGLVFFDELNCYYTEAVGDDYVLATNQLADLTVVNQLIENKVTEQGDYTLDSFNNYTEKVNEAIEAIKNPYITPNKVNELVNAINEAYSNLATREITTKVAELNKMIITGNTLEISYNDYFDTADLSSVTFEYESSLTLAVVDGVLTLDTTSVEINTYSITLKALYKGEVKQSVTLSVNVVAKSSVTVKEAELSYNIDLYKDSDILTIDLSDNIVIVGDLDVTYIVDGEESDSLMEVTFAEGTYELNVVVKYTYIDEQEVSYKLVFNVIDTTPYRLFNGDFETGDLEGWTLEGQLGAVSNESHYWKNDSESVEGFSYNKDGKFLFDAYKNGVESAVGTLTSSNFIVGGSCYVTFKLGAMRDGNYVYVDVVDASTKEILARYYNGLWSERTDGMKSGCTLIAYKADLSEFEGKEVFFRISDNADSGYGLFFVDSFETYYASEPEGFNVATAVDYQVSGTIYDIFNGGFEMGDNRGWWNNGEPGAVTNADAFFSGVAYGKEGNFLYSGVEDHMAGNGREGNKGTLTSSVFEIGGIGYISFMLGGGGNELCYVQVIDAVTNEILVRYHQQAMEDAVLKTYVADLSAYIGRTVRIQVVDYAHNNWGCVSFDNVVTYYKSIDELPEGITANNIFGGVYNVTNGSFENGLDGWTMDIHEAGDHNTLGWVESTEINEGWYTKNDDRKDGNNLFTFAKPGLNCENTKGTLNSSVFTLNKDSYVAFRFGGAGTRDVHVQLVRVDGTVIATFYNEALGKINTEMYAYYYQYSGETADCFFRVVDNSVGNYGCFVVDDFRANLNAAPEGFIEAIR